MHLYKVYIAPMPKSGQTLDMTDKTKFVPVTQLSKDAGINLHWSNDSKTLHWTLGNEYFSSEVSENAKLVESGIKIKLEVKTELSK